MKRALGGDLLTFPRAQSAESKKARSWSWSQNNKIKVSTNVLGKTDCSRYWDTGILSLIKHNTSSHQEDDPEGLAGRRIRAQVSIKELEFNWRIKETHNFTTISEREDLPHGSQQYYFDPSPWASSLHNEASPWWSHKSLWLACGMW